MYSIYRATSIHGIYSNVQYGCIEHIEMQSIYSTGSAKCSLYSMHRATSIHGIYNNVQYRCVEHISRYSVYSNGSDKCSTYSIYRATSKHGIYSNVQYIQPSVYMRWLRLVAFVKLYVSSAKEPYKRDDILQKRLIILRSIYRMYQQHQLSTHS